MGQIVSHSIGDLHNFFVDMSLAGDRQKIASPLIAEIARRLRFLIQVGTDYLTLNRGSETLSGGELQRVRLATSVGSGLTRVCYVLDEPSIGLHPRDSQRLIESLEQLKQRGNSVIVVEHDESIMRSADFIVDIGPGAGRSGGRIVAAGTIADVMAATASVTAQYLTGRLSVEIPRQRRQCSDHKSIQLKGARGNNLKNIDVSIPLGLMTCVTGVSGSGKSTLINQTLAPAIWMTRGQESIEPAPYAKLMGVENIDRLIRVDQSPMGHTPRGCAATYSGIFDEIRKVFAATKRARQLGFKSSRFSFNSKSGWCPDCKGYGLKTIGMNYLPDIVTVCHSCNGRRFNAQTLQIRFRGLTIADVLALSVTEAATLFSSFSRIAKTLLCLEQVGLGYLPLGQPSNTISGGEAQRIQLATELSRAVSDRSMFLLDEPTTGLHFGDVRNLLNVLRQLVDSGNTVVVIEHNLEVIKCADWIIDLGPEGGAAGGQVVGAGTPEEIAATEGSITGQFLQELLAARRPSTDQSQNNSR
jgi:excinuclease ABC subunit A